MGIANWIDSIKNAEKTAIVEGGKRKVHYLFPDGQEMVEEYSMDTDVLLKRMFRKNSHFRGKSHWEVEVGDPEPNCTSLDNIDIKESSDCPYVISRVTKTALEWRIRNLPYPIDTYMVSADPSVPCITIRTVNKKYFKKLPVPLLVRAGIIPEQNKIDVSHKFNTLIITYQKPQELLQLEKAILEEVKKVPLAKEGNPECKTS